MGKSGILREYKRKRLFTSHGKLEREQVKASWRRRQRRTRLRPGQRCGAAVAGSMIDDNDVRLPDLMS
jgi:hypothetical protein